MLPYESNWLAGIIVNHGLDLTCKFRSSFLIRTIRERFPIYHTFVITIRLILLFLNPLHGTQIDTQRCWNLCIGASSVNVMQYSIPFHNLWKRKLHHGAAFLQDTSLLHSRQSLKQAKCMHYDITLLSQTSKVTNWWKATCWYHVVRHSSAWLGASGGVMVSKLD